MISPCVPLLQSARERSRLHQESHMWAVGRKWGREGGEGEDGEDGEEAKDMKRVKSQKVTPLTSRCPTLTTGCCTLTYTYRIKVERDFYILGGHMRKDGLATNIFVKYKCCSKVVAVFGKGDCSGRAFQILR